MTAGLLLVAMVLATYRVTRLVTIDQWPPVAVPRERWSAGHEGHWLTYLWNCPFCVGVWVAGVVTFATWLFVRDDGAGLPLPVLWWAAVAGGCGLVYEVLARLPDA